MSLQLSGVDLADSPAAWRTFGFHVGDDGVTSIGAVTVRLDRGVDRPAWTFDGSVASTIDGIQTATNGQTTSEGPNPNGAVDVDHIVVQTPDLDRTTGAFVGAGLDLRKRREVGSREQRFFWAGDVIVELVGPVEPSGDESASIWGLALVSRDLDASKETLGELLSDPKDAVQPGRRIAAIRTRAHSASVTIALMTPHA